MAIGKTNAQRKILLTTPGAVTPTKSQQIITTPDGYDGMDQVAINAIPDNYIDTSAGDATAAQILYGKKAYVDGSLVTGTMTNRGNVGTINLDSTTTTYTIPKGYHNGNGKVTASIPTLMYDESLTFYGTGSSNRTSNIYINNISNQPLALTIFGNQEQTNGCIYWATINFNNGNTNNNTMCVVYYYNGYYKGCIFQGWYTYWNGSQIIIEPMSNSNINLYYSSNACEMYMSYLSI